MWGRELINKEATMNLAWTLVRSVALFLFVLTVTVADARARVRDHDSGFFLRLSAGVGAADTEFDEPTFPAEVSGTSGDLNLAIGGVVSPNLALHATIFGWALSDPDVNFGGASGELQGDVSLSAIGGGVTYYFMPVNIYVSGSIAAASITVETSTGRGETDLGPAFDLTVGKEWWVSDRWGLGVAAAFGYHSVPEQGVNENWSGVNFAVRFTATLN